MQPTMSSKSVEAQSLHLQTPKFDSPTSDGQSALNKTDPEKPLDVEARAATNQVPLPREITGIRWFLVIITILSSVFLFALDNTVAANVQPAIVERFNAVSRLPWISVAYLLGAASVNLFWYVLPFDRCHGIL